MYNMTNRSSRLSGRVLSALNGWHRDPFTHRPDVVGQTRRHRRRPLPYPAVLVPILQRPHGPAEIIAIYREIGHRLVHPPILRERVRLPHLPGIPVPVGRVVSLQERHVDPPAHPREP